MPNPDWHQHAKTIDLSIHNLIDGQRYLSVPAKDIVDIEKYSPHNGQLLYSFSCGKPQDVNQAAIAARTAFTQGHWSKLPVAKRAEVLYRLIDLVEQHRETLALYECLDVGKPISNALNDISGVVSRLRTAATLATQLHTNAAVDCGHLSYQRYKPRGVVACIGAWNFPLMIIAGQMAPALMMGNSIIIKPSEFTSLATQHLVDLAHKAGIPAGVINIVHGEGNIVGDALARHPDIDMVAFVGSSATGRQIMTTAGQSNMKQVLMECGGKSPFIVFDDCPDDLEVLAQRIVGAAFGNQGENCMAGSRLLLQKGMGEKLLPLVVEKAAAIKAGDPLNPDTRFGALINEAHLNKVLAYIDSGRKQGANLLTGGERVVLSRDDALGNSLEKGFYLEPTIFDQVSPDSTIAQEEIFGPVLSVTHFTDEAEAIALANNSSYGLAAYAATTNLSRAQRLGEQLNCGGLFIYASNTSTGSAAVLGATKHQQSGNGFKGGEEGMREYAIPTTMHFFT